VVKHYSLKPINEIKCKQRFYELLEDGISLFQKGCDEIEKSSQYLSELKSMHGYLEQVGDGKALPKTRYHPIDGIDNASEFKTKNLRVYLYTELGTGKIIIFVGTKTSQKADIKQVKSIVQNYINSKSISSKI
jgi:hypothetical protein